jgi:hypothetical protein
MPQRYVTAPDRAEALRPFCPAVILPVQLVYGSRTQASPEQRLLIAVLEDAIYCFERYHDARDCRSRRLFREAEEWIMGAHDSQPLSFEYVCAVLDLEPSAVRCSLRRLHQCGGPDGCSHIQPEA